MVTKTNKDEKAFSAQTEIDPSIIKNQATINIGTIGHVAHGKSTLVRMISGVTTIKYKSELERNITIKLGYANAKIYECNNSKCSRPGRYKSFGSGEMREKIPCLNCRTELEVDDYLQLKNKICKDLKDDKIRNKKDSGNEKDISNEGSKNNNDNLSNEGSKNNNDDISNEGFKNKNNDDDISDGINKNNNDNLSNEGSKNKNNDNLSNKFDKNYNDNLSNRVDKNLNDNLSDGINKINNDNLSNRVDKKNDIINGENNIKSNSKESENVTNNDYRSKNKEDDSNETENDINNGNEEGSSEFVEEESSDQSKYKINGYLELKRHVSFVDCPGHDVLMATMLTGTAIMDTAILLIASNETCPQPQTQEHLFAVEIMGLDKLIIVQNKIDLISREKAIEHREGIAEFLKGTKAENCPVVPASCQLNCNVDAVLDFIVNYVPIPDREKKITNKNKNEVKDKFDDKNTGNNKCVTNKKESISNNNDNSDDVENVHTKMVIIRSFDVNKPGCAIEDLQGGIIGGSLVSGRLYIGDNIEIRPGYVTKERGKFICKPYTTKIISLKAEANDLEFAVPGGLIGVGTIMDPYFCRADKLVGQVMGIRGKMPFIYSDLDIEYSLFKKIAGVSTRESLITRLRESEQYLLNVGSTTTGAIISKMKNEKEASFSIAKPVCCEINERIAISRKVDNHWRLIGYGKIKSGKTIEPQYN